MLAAILCTLVQATPPVPEEVSAAGSWSRVQRKKRIPKKAIRLIRKIAIKQVEEESVLTVPEYDLVAELEKAFDKAKISYDRMYSEVLEGIRSQLIAQEIKQIIAREEEMDEEDAFLLML